MSIVERLISMMAKNGQHFVFVLLMLGAFVPPFWGAVTSAPSPRYVIPEQNIAPQKSRDPVYEERVASPPKLTAFAHSPSLTPLPNGQILLVWYAGSGEKSPDVVLYQATYDPRQDIWTAPRVLTDPAASQAELGRYVYTLGNPALLTDPQERTLLFYVTRWSGGWSTSTLNMKVSEDHGATWTQAKRLVTNPYLNSGTLVRARPFLYEDGSIGLPGYHELVGTFPEVFRISSEGHLLSKARIFYSGSSLQPSVIPLDQNQAIALLRNKRVTRKRAQTDAKRMLMATTEDRGEHWSPPEPLELPNPNSSVAGIRLSDKSLLVAFNNSARGRGNLALARSADRGQHWTVIATLDEGGDFSYPSLIQANDGIIHLVYAWNRTRIKHIFFNTPWLNSQRP
jgi:predicted neuraminidase